MIGVSCGQHHHENFSNPKRRKKTPERIDSILHGFNPKTIILLVQHRFCFLCLGRALLVWRDSSGDHAPKLEIKKTMQD